MKTFAIAAVMLAFTAQPPTTERPPASVPAGELAVAAEKQVPMIQDGAASRSVFFFKFNPKSASSAGANMIAEPIALALLLGSMGLVGAAMRRRANTEVTYD